MNGRPDAPTGIPMATPSSWVARLAASVTNTGSTASLPPPASPRSPIASVDDVVYELRSAIDELVEPAIAALRLHESQLGSNEDCFHGSAGEHLRFRCCVYFSTLAAGLLEWRFGVDNADANRNVPFARAPSAYSAIARWLLRPPPLSEAHAIAHAESLMASADSAARAGAYSLDRMRDAASQLAGPLGQYETKLHVGGVRGTLWRCEVSTAHTFLVFEPSAGSGLAEDLIVDVSYKQFLVLPELMHSHHFDAARAIRLFDDEPESFVGPAAALDEKMSLSSLRAAFRRVDHAVAGGGAARLSTHPDLGRLAALRNDGVFALRDRERRKRMCGRPWQSAESG